MAKNICITEKQYKMALKEGVLPGNQKISVNATNATNDPEDNIRQTQNAIRKSGGNVKDFSIHTPNPGSKDTEIVSKSETTDAGVNETKFLSKKQLQENRLKILKKNSEVYTVKDFLNKIKK